ncbi:hypothetical protein J2739_001794 [Variovorax soli]|uniref:Uncharacterized protein n=1 Tax=Variovorax soli TaxID=376815 RepID=A0ABU1NC68_9BURK|nr:hypothetical protein [Variovorax soli]
MRSKTRAVARKTGCNKILGKQQTDTRYAETMYGSKFGAMRLYYESEEKSLWINEYGVDANNKVVSILLSNSP